MASCLVSKVIEGNFLTLREIKVAAEQKFSKRYMEFTFATFAYLRNREKFSDLKRQKSGVVPSFVVKFQRRRIIED